MPRSSDGRVVPRAARRGVGNIRFGMYWEPPLPDYTGPDWIG